MPWARGWIVAQSVTDLTKKAAAYACPRGRSTEWTCWRCEEAAHRAALAVRSGEGPYFLECRTYRFRAHSMYDPELYRDKAEVEEWKKRDPIATFESPEADGMLDDANAEA